ncbi:MAG: helix-turn-helix domain-containing protein [Clostridia bacterium]|nr:helix-turn-helix domain-containing protein [Clostridia bacterium]
MYEPKYLPSFEEEAVSLGGIRFAIVHADKYIPQNNPDADPMHVHKYLEIFFNLSSDVSFFVNNTLYPVSVGHALVSRPDDIHMAVFHGSAVQEHLCIWVEAESASPLLSFAYKDDFFPLFSFDEQTAKRFRTLACSLLEATAKGGSPLKKMSCLLQILTLFENEQTERTERLSLPESFQRVLDYIHDNLAQIRTVSDIVSSLYVSSATLTRWFRKHLNTSPREYLESVRLSHAAVLLTNGSSVTEASMLSGFSDCSHFIVLFKRRFGVTPLKYKKKQSL